MSRVVLVVDDEALVLDVTAMMLQDLGYEVITASNAEDALHRLAAEQRIGVLVTDVAMPGMDGIALARAATRMRDDLRVIVVSAHVNMGHGFPVVRKPFQLEDLRQTMAMI
jgi:two-component system, cell cycle response regulator CpdR